MFEKVTGGVFIHYLPFYYDYNIKVNLLKANLLWENFQFQVKIKEGFFNINVYLFIITYTRIQKKNLKYQKMRKVDAGADEWSCRAVFAFLVSAENDFVQIGNYLERLTRDEQH